MSSTFKRGFSIPLAILAVLVLLAGSYFLLTSNKNATLSSISSQSQLAQVVSVPTTGQVGYWALDDGSGTTATDASGSGNNGTFVGSPTWITGHIGGALSFNGSSYVNIPAPVYSISAGTVSLWVNPSSGGIPIGSYNSSNTSRAPTFIISSSGALSWEFSNLTSQKTSITVPSNTWTHLAMTYSGGSVSVYENGTLVASGTATPLTSLYNAVHLGHYANYGSLFYSGAIDDVRIYNRALAASEISQIYSYAVPTITALTPASNVTWTIGQTYPITWSSTNPQYAGTVRIWLLNQTTGNLYNLVGPTLPNTGSTNIQISTDVSGTPIPPGTYSLQVRFSPAILGTAPGTITLVAASGSSSSYTGAPIISNILASNLSSNGGTISWTTNVPATSQLVYGLTSAYGSNSALFGGLSTTHAVNITSSLSPNTTYHYAVISGDVNGTTTSPDQTFTTLSQGQYGILGVATPGGSITPTGMAVVNAGGSQTFLITPNTGYQIKLVSVDGTSVGAISSYTFSNVQTNHSITAVFSTSTISLATPPPAPSGLVGTPSATSIALSWTASPGATSYTIYRNGTSVGTATTNSYTDTGLTAGTSYSYTVTASNSAGSSPQSSTVAVTTTAVTIYSVTVSPSGTGTGTVVSSGSINCGSTCTANGTAGMTVNLTATPSTGSTFGGWSGIPTANIVSGCSTTTTCSFTLTANTTVTATFTTTGSITTTTGGNWYVVPGGAGAKTGKDWNNATDISTIPWTSVQPGDTIWLAGGTYTNDPFSPKASGTASKSIYIERVLSTDAVPTAAAGWNSAFDSQVIVTNTTADNTNTGCNAGDILCFNSSSGNYTVWDGRVDSGISLRTSNIAGLSPTNNTTPGQSALDIVGGGNHDITFNNFDFAGPAGSAMYTHASYDNAVQISNVTGNVLITNSRIHGANNDVNLYGSTGVTFDHDKFYDNVASLSSAGHGNVIQYADNSNVTLRYSEWWNWGIEGFNIWTASGSLYVYGNVFHDSYNVSGNYPSVIQSNASAASGPLYFYNNTISNVYGYCVFRPSSVGWTTGSQARNNVYVNSDVCIQYSPTDSDYDAYYNDTTANNASLGITTTLTVAQSEAHDVALPASPFVNSTGDNFQLTANTTAGANLGSPYNIDPTGATRTTWTRGAYEYVGSGTVTPPPTTYTVTSSATTGGTISPLGSTSVSSGGSQAYVITPNSGYQVGTVTVDGTVITTIPTTGGTYTFSNVTATHTISVTFTAVVVVTPPSTTFTVGQQVQVLSTVGTGGLSVRSTPGTSSPTVTGSPEASGALATVTTAPSGYTNGVLLNGYNWWYLTYANGTVGWSAEVYLTAYTPVTTTTTGGNWYVVPGGAGAKTGKDWNNATDISTIPWASVKPGDTVWLAGGTYTNTMTVTTSGTAANLIYVKRVCDINCNGITDAVPVAAAGWNSSFDSQVIVAPGSTNSSGTPFSIGATLGVGSYVTVDGRIDSGISFEVNPTVGACAVMIGGYNGGNVSHITFNNIDMMGPDHVPGTFITQPGTNGATCGLGAYTWNGNGYNSVSYIDVSHSRMHGALAGVELDSNISYVTIEYSKLYDIGSNDLQHDNLLQLTGSIGPMIFRYNQAWNWQAEGFRWWDSAPGPLPYYVYGNVFYNGGPIIQPDSSFSGQMPFYFVNNTIYNLPSHTLDTCAPAAAGNTSVCNMSGSLWENNLYINSGEEFANSADSDSNDNLDVSNPAPYAVGTWDYNYNNVWTSWDWVGHSLIDVHGISNSGINPLVSTSTGNYSIVGTIGPNYPRDKGTPIPSVNDPGFGLINFGIDPNGTVRGSHNTDGGWDIGAYEY